jgi:hypothetical protein
MPHPVRHLFSVLAAVCAAFILSASLAYAEDKAPPPARKPAQPDIVLPAPENTLILIRTALLRVNDGLETGNYTVLRDLGAPSFREANSAGRLYQIFAPLAAQGIDLSAVAILTPQLPQVPSLDEKRRLHISGYFPGDPVQINFSLEYEAVAGRWRLFGIAVAPAAPAAVPHIAGTAEQKAVPPQQAPAKPRKQP